jgi:probable F420-dependent oxidoreductase
VLDATRRVVVAPGIVNLWMHAASETAAAHHHLTREHPDRFLLGLGVSHAALVDAGHPGRYRHPRAATEGYLDELDAAEPPVPTSERVLAALGPRMLALAGARTAGAHPYLVTPEHTASARAALGPRALLAPEQHVVLEDDPATARDVARSQLAIYLGLPNYLNSWRRLGFAEEDVAPPGSDRLVDALVAWGDEATAAGRVRAHLDAGADHVCVQAAATDLRALPLEAWRRLAPALSS